MAGVELLCVVTGGRGFVARHLVQRLLQSGRWIVRIMDLSPNVRLSEEELLGPLGTALLDGHAQYVSADLRNREQVFDACKGATVVFHMAAPDSSVNNFKLHYDVTVMGTRNVIDACVHLKVKKLIYTSSPSVVFDGMTDIHNADESLPYPDKYNDFYSETKAQAEALVLKANGKAGLLTCAIRPSGIFGPGDGLMVPSLVNAAKSGKLKFIIGNGENLFDFTYVENVAHAHICAEEALVHGVNEDESASGKAYFVTNLEPRKFWDFMGEIVQRLGYKRPTFHLPVKVVMPLAYLAEWGCKKLAPLGMPTTQFTPSRIHLMTCWRSFNCARAEQYLKYTAPISFEEGINRTVDAFWHLRAEIQDSKSRKIRLPSKIHSYFGSGKVADLLLWRNAKQSLVVLLSIFGVCHWFFQSSYTLIFLIARMLLLLVLALFTYSHLHSSILDSKLPQVPMVVFEIPKEKVYSALSCISFLWSVVVNRLQLMVRERSWSQFFQILFVLQFLKFLGSFSMQGLAHLGTIGLFILPYIYEHHMQEIIHFTNRVGGSLDGYRKVAHSNLLAFARGLLPSRMANMRKVSFAGEMGSNNVTIGEG